MKFEVSFYSQGGERERIGKADIFGPSVCGRIQLVQEIWNRIAEVPDAIP